MIGSVVYFFDINRRVYREPKPGRISSGGPIWREHWRPEKIVAEKARSWVTSTGRSFAKTKQNDETFSWDVEWINALAYVHDNRHKISEAVRGIRDYQLLLKVAGLIGYKPESEGETGR